MALNNSKYDMALNNSIPASNRWKTSHIWKLYRNIHKITRSFAYEKFLSKLLKLWDFFIPIGIRYRMWATHSQRFSFPGVIKLWRIWICFCSGTSKMKKIRVKWGNYHKNENKQKISMKLHFIWMGNFCCWIDWMGDDEEIGYCWPISMENRLITYYMTTKSA